ncbi:hypothetical protein PMI09_00467 [Rhizobium sp. CF122]|nr:hypothetical protein PMI09_00467 [Rhizobium sp. CF122]
MGPLADSGLKAAWGRVQKYCDERSKTVPLASD